MIVVVMGVAGCGKTTLARALCERLGWTLCDADDLHPPANVAAMRAGRPLTDADRAPWLDAIAALHADWQAAGISGATACSALRAAYRARLRANGPAFRLVYLDTDPDLARRRVGNRPGHYFPTSLVDSQFAALEPPGPEEDPIRLDAGADLSVNVEAVVRALGLS